MSKILLLTDPLDYDKRKVIEVPAGMTIAEMRAHKDIRGIIDPVEEVTVSRMGEIIPFENYETDIIHPNDYLMVLPKCGDDDIVKTVAMVGLILVAGPMATAIGGGAIGGIGFTTGAMAWGVTGLTIAIMVGGGMIISSMGSRPQLPSSAMPNPDNYSQAYGWNPITTQSQDLKIANVFGKILVQGNLIEGYRIVTGDETNLQTLYANIGIGEGPVYIPVVDGTLKINDQISDNFNNAYYSTRYGNMVQEAIGWSQRCHFETTPFIKVTNSDGAKIHETKGNLFDSLIIDVSFPGGLYDGTGAALANHTVNITLEFKKASASAWDNIITENITADVNTPVIRSYVTEGIASCVRGEKYQVRLAKNTADKNDPLWGDELYLDTVKEVTHEEFRQPGLASVNLNALATGQLSGSLRASWITLGKYIRRWTGAAWEIVYNNSLAWVIYHVFTQPVFTGSHSPWLDLKLMLNFEEDDAATETIDESPKGHAITFVGSAEIDTAQKKFDTASVLLDGTDSCLTIANDGRSFNVLHNINENWTIDIEVKFADHDGTEYLTTQYEDDNNRWLLVHVHGSGLYFQSTIGGILKVSIVEAAGEIDDNNWHHIAVCKVGSDIGLYLDETQIGYDLMVASDTNIYDGDLFIGQQGDDTDWFQGHIDHLRIVQNNILNAAPNVGLTDTITEPAAAYTDPGNSYVDAEHEAYSDSKMDLPSFVALETWCDAVRVNPVSFGIISISQAVNAIIVTTSNHNCTIGDKILFRGVSICGMTELVDGTTATVLKVTNNVTFTIDLDTSGFAAYTGAEPKLLIHFDGASGSTDFTDETEVHNITTVGDVEVSATKKFGTGSGYFPGTDDALSIPDHADWDVVASNADNWTIDFFVKHLTTLPHGCYLAQDEDADNYWSLWIGDGCVIFDLKIAGVFKIEVWNETAIPDIDDTNWHHVAWCKVANKYGIYVDGIQIAYTEDNDVGTIAALLHIGSDHAPEIPSYFDELDGYMDELCIIDNNRFNANPNIGKTDTINVPEISLTLGIGTIEEYLSRFAFNGVIDTDRNLWETAIHLCKLCRCVPYMKGSKIAIAINKSTSSSYMFNMSNIDAGSFKELFLPKNERAYEITSQFRNKAADYKRQSSPVPNANIENTSNRVTQDRFGITDKTTVDDLSRFELLENEHIDLAVQFRGDVDAIPVKIGDVVDFTHDVSNWHKIGQLSEHYTGSGQIKRAINGTTAAITIDGKINFVDADFDGGSLTYKIKAKMSDDSMELKTITGHAVVDGEHSILVAGPFDMTPKPGDMWSAGQENLQTRTFRVSNMRTTQILKSDILLTEYVEACFEND